MKTAIIIGATGLVGTELIQLLIHETEYSRVWYVSRKKSDITHQKLIHIPFNSGNYEIPPDIDLACSCLGTTIRKAGSQAAFRSVDVDMIVDFARKSKHAGIRYFSLVSSIGARSNSRNFYLKTKGETEELVQKITFTGLRILRPSILLGKRKDTRIAEDIGKALYFLFSFLFIGKLRKYKGVSATHVAYALIHKIYEIQGVEIIESDLI